MGEKVAGNVYIIQATDVGVGEVESEGVVDKVENAIHRYHDKHADDAVDHVALAVLIVSAFVQIPEKLHETPNEEKKSQRENHQDRRVDDVGHKLVHQAANCLHSGLRGRAA